MLTGTVAGNLGRDAELRHVQSGDAVLEFSVASNEKGKGGEKTTTWIRCKLWGKRGEAVAQFLTRGVYVVANGSISLREYKANDGSMKTSLEMRVGEIAFHGGDRGDSQSGGRDPSGGDARGAAPAQPGGGGYGRGGYRLPPAQPAAPPPADDYEGGGGYGGGDDPDIPF